VYKDKEIAKALKETSVRNFSQIEEKRKNKKHYDESFLSETRFQIKKEYELNRKHNPNIFNFKNYQAQLKNIS
jgi:hypothetical protein